VNTSESFLTNNELEYISKHINTTAISLLNGTNIIITGGLGFLGTHFLYYFKYLNDNILDTPMKIYVLDSNIVPSLKIKNKQQYIFEDKNIEFHQHDIREPFSIKSKYILSAAGIASPFYYQKYPLDTLDVSYLGTKNVLENAKENNSRVLTFSSSEIYGNPDSNNIPTKETYKGLVSSMGPRSCYDEGKRIGEALASTYYKMYNTDVSIVRPFNIYGPGMRKEDYRVIPSFADAIFNHRDITAHGQGIQTRTYCYVTDAIIGFLKILLFGRAGEVYNIGNPKPEITVIDLAEKMLKIAKAGFVKSRSKIKLIDYPESYPADEPMRRCPDITKAKQELGYNPTISLKEGLAKYLEWKVENEYTY